MTRKGLRLPLLVSCALGICGMALTSCASGSGSLAGRTPGSGSLVDCPLTGAPPSDGSGVSNRPALAVKVDNYPAARPQSGLDKADIVFEEPVEGGITRYVAVFQCQQAALVGPIRSARNIDIGILGQFGHPLLVHVGGIRPVLANIDASPLVDVDLGAHPSVIQHVAGRVAPYDTYASTSALWDLEGGRSSPPPAIFSYSASPPRGTPAKTVAIPFSDSSNVVWRYDPSLGSYLRNYGSTPDILSDGHQNAAANVIVQIVHITYGPWLENSAGGLEVQANLYQSATGRAEIFRNGLEVTGSWSRNGLSRSTQFTAANGSPISARARAHVGGTGARHSEGRRRHRMRAPWARGRPLIEVTDGHARLCERNSPDLPCQFGTLAGGGGAMAARCRPGSRRSTTAPDHEA